MTDLSSLDPIPEKLRVATPSRNSWEKGIMMRTFSCPSKSSLMCHFVSNIVRKSLVYELTFYIAPEDCASRCLTKEEMGDEPEGGKIHQMDDAAAQEKVGGQDMNDNEWEKENGDEDDDEGDSKPKLAGLSDYEKRREQNKAAIALILADLKEQYPIPEDLMRVSKPKKPAMKKKNHDDKPGERRVSTRNKVNDTQRQVVLVILL
jgi:hypothetical protein